MAERRQQEIGGSFGPWKLNIRNYDAISVIIIIGGICMMLGLAAITFIFFKIYDVGGKEHQAIIIKLDKSNELQEEQNYLSSLPIDSRPKLSMPDSMCKKLYGPSDYCLNQERIRNYDDAQRKAK